VQKMYFKVTVQLTAVTLTVDITRMTTGTSRSWGAIWKFAADHKTRV